MEGDLNIYYGLAVTIIAFSLIAGGFVLVFTQYHKKTVAHRQTIHEMDMKHQKDLISSHIKSSEDERIRVAKDIHDEIGGVFSALSLSLMQIRREEPAGAKEKIELSKSLVLSGIESVRRISHAIVPFDLELFGLEKAIMKHLDTASAVSGINTQFSNHCDLTLLSSDIALSVFRILQELVSNTLKYSGASELKIEFNYEATGLKMTYSDNGKGMDMNVNDQIRGIGLKNIESRTISLGASLDIASAPGQGMSCMVTIPSETLQII